MRRRTSSAAFLLAMLPACASAQDGPKSGSLEGSVVNGITGEPVAHARVTLMIPDYGHDAPPKGYGAMTGDDGKFSWSSIPPGRYSIGANVHGFLETDRPSRIEIGPDSAVRDVKLTVIPEAIFTGRVLDSHGDPVQGARVSATVSGSVGITNDRGEFRLTGLGPGKYRLHAVAPAVTGPPEVRTDGTKEECLAPTFYPSAISAAEAALVAALPGAQVSGLEIRLATIPIVRIGGTVTGPATKELSVSASNPGTYYLQGSSLVRDGKFAIWRLPPGRYRVSAIGRTADGGLVQSYPIEVDLAGSNIDNLALETVPEFDLAGQVEWDGTPPPADQWKDAAIVFDSQEPAKIAADGSFRVPRMRADKHRLDLMGMPPNVFVKSIRVGSDEVPGRDLDLRKDPKGARVTIVLSGAGAQISGVAKSGDAPAMALICLAPDVEPLQCDRAIQTNTDGAFAFVRIPPGRYKLYAAEFGTKLPGANPVESIELEEGQKIKRDVPVSSGQ